MTDKVLKPFNTPTRRFKEVGAVVTEADVADHALGFDGLKSAGFIGDERAPAASFAADAAAPPDHA